MKPRSSPVVWMLVCLIFATAVGTVQIFAQQPTSTPSLSVSIPTPTPLPNLELRVHELEMEQAQTIKSLESSNRIMTWIGGFFAVLVTFQTAVQGAATVRRWRREEQRDEGEGCQRNR